VETSTASTRLPDFLIVGAAKSGTTSLYYYLRQHPQVFLPPGKECWYFALAGEGLPRDPFFERISPITGVGDYIAQFAPATPNQVVGECSTAYLHLWSRTIPAILRTYDSREPPSIIIVLRDPVRRAYSHYQFDLQQGYVDGTFEEALNACREGRASPYNDYLSYGRYSDQVRAYLREFERVKVCLSDELASRPQETVREVLDFLGVDPDHPVDTGFRSNVSGTPRRAWLTSLVLGDNLLKRAVKPFLSDATRERLRTSLLRGSLRREPMSEAAESFLRDYYRDDIRELSGLIGRDLSGWAE
jgi:hypothetical protein